MLRTPTSIWSRDRKDVAELLNEQGPIPGATAAEALGWTAERWWMVVSRGTEWFELTGKGWVLTTAGQSAIGRGVEEGNNVARVKTTV